MHVQMSSTDRYTTHIYTIYPYTHSVTVLYRHSVIVRRPSLFLTSYSCRRSIPIHNIMKLIGPLVVMNHSAITIKSHIFCKGFLFRMNLKVNVLY